MCKGTCNTWIHRHCAGLSKIAFTAATESSDAFVCPHCYLVTLGAELTSLKCTVNTLLEKVSFIKVRLAQFQPTQSLHHAIPWLVYMISQLISLCLLRTEIIYRQNSLQRIRVSSGYY